MRSGFLSSVMALLAGVGPALAQAPASPAPPSAPAASSTPAADPFALGAAGAAKGEAARPRDEAGKSLAASAQDPVMPGMVGAQVMPAAPPPLSAVAPPAHPVIPPAAPPGNGCATGACGAGGACADVPMMIGNRFYGSAEYILWKVQSAPLPPAQLTVPFTVSGLNLFSSTITFAGNDVELDGLSGGRFTLGYWCHPDQLLGLEATYFQLERRAQGFGGVQVVDLPLNVNVIQNITTVSAVATTITQVPLAVTLPAELSVASKGSTGVNNFYGAEANARSTRCQIGGVVIDVLGGFRYLDFDEQLTLSEGILLSVANPVNLAGPGPIPPNPLPPIPQPVTGLRPLAAISTFDQISTRNRFFGAQVGTSADWWVSERLILSGWGKFGVGAMVQDVNLTGFTTTSFSPTGGGDYHDDDPRRPADAGRRLRQLQPHARRGHSRAEPERRLPTHAEHPGHGRLQLPIHQQPGPAGQPGRLHGQHDDDRARRRGYDGQRQHAGHQLPRHRHVGAGHQRRVPDPVLSRVMSNE